MPSSCRCAEHGLHWISSAVTRSAVQPCEKCHETSRKGLGCPRAGVTLPGAPQAMVPSGVTHPEGFAGQAARLAFARSWRAFALHFLPRILEDTDPNVTLWDLAYTQTSLGSCTGGGSVLGLHSPRCRVTPPLRCPSRSN